MIKATVEFKDESTEVIARMAVFGDTLMGLLAATINNKIVTSGKVPLLPKSTKWAQRGALRASIRSRKVSVGRYVVTAGENSPASAYAAAQEAGITRGHPIKNYSTPGTGPHWFRDGVDSGIEQAGELIQTAKDRAGLT